MKNWLYTIAILGIFASCTPGRQTAVVKQKPPPSGEPRFLENISIRPQSAGETIISEPRKTRGRIYPAGSPLSTNIENCHNLQFKYAILMDEPVEKLTDTKLLNFLDDWYGTPYRFGGGTRQGIDCSAFTCVLMDSIFNISLPRTSREQYSVAKPVGRNELMRGDLVFFNTTGGVSHVGVYLGNNKFVHASTSSGVMISDLDEYYFKRRYVGAGRVR